MSISEHYTDALKEFVNIGVGKSANILNNMLDAHITLNVPRVQNIFNSELSSVFPYTDENLSSIQLDIQGAFAGNAALIFSPDSAHNLVSILTEVDIDSDEIEEIKEETLTEIGNILINGVMGAVANSIQQNLEYAPPKYKEATLNNLLSLISSDEKKLMIDTHFEVTKHNIKGNIIILLNCDSVSDLCKSIDKL
jgi:chemotaxis protein CheC